MHGLLKDSFDKDSNNEKTNKKKRAKRKKFNQVSRTKEKFS
jgi:hypothetical protein